MEEVVHALKSPYSNGYVRMVVPSCLTGEQLQEVVRIARQTATDLAGVSDVPQSFSSFPINRVGKAALVLVSSTMPDQLADGIEGAILLNMMAAFKFLRQLLDRVAGKVPMKRDEYISGIISYCNRFTPHFTDALRLRLPVLVKQATDVTPPMPDLAQRLSRLSDIALSTISSLRDIIGSDAYERWLERKNFPRSPDAPTPDKFGTAKAEEPVFKEEEEEEVEAEKEEAPRIVQRAPKEIEPASDNKKKEEKEEEEEFDEEDDFDIQSGAEEEEEEDDY